MTRPPAVRGAAALAGLAVLACAATRMGYLLGPVVQFNADEAATGIMVRDILAGRLYVFYAGQDYGGALEQYLQAAAYLAFRLPENALTLRLPLVGLSMLTCALVYLLGREVLGDPARAAVAAWLYAVWPWANVVGTVTSLGFYAAGQALATAALYGALRSGSGPRSRWWLAGTGLCAGLAVWTALTSLYLLVPALLWLLPVLGRDCRRWAALAGGFALGALPLLAWLALHRVLPVPGDPAERTTVLQRLVNLVDPVLREYVGVAYGNGTGGLWLPLQVAVLAGLGIAYLAALARRCWLRDLLLRRPGRRPADVLLAVPPVVVVLWVASDSTWYVGTPRYLVGTYPLLAVGVAALLPVAAPRALPAAVVALSAALSLGLYPGMAGAPDTADRDAVLGQVADTLAAAGQTHVVAGYWTGMPLQYVAGDRLVVATVGGVSRFPRAQAAVAADPDAVVVGSEQDSSTAMFRSALDRHRLPYRTRTVGVVTIFDRLPAGAAAALLD